MQTKRSVTIKAAWIGLGGMILGAIITGIFHLVGSSNGDEFYSIERNNTFVNESNSQKLKKNTFFISEFPVSELVDQIKLSTGYNWAESSYAQYIIVFNYSNGFRESSYSEYCLYDGDNLSITINGEICNPYDIQLPLPKYNDEPGNRKTDLVKSLKKYIQDLIDKGLVEITRNIVKCIKADTSNTR